MMKDEKNTADNPLANSEDKGLATNPAADDSYYDVDDPKKEFHSTIGDGEMHNEGLVGDGSAAADDDTFSEGTTTEQQQAENHDSEG